MHRGKDCGCALAPNTACSAGGLGRFTSTGHGAGGGENGSLSIQTAVLPSQASASSRWSQCVTSRLFEMVRCLRVGAWHPSTRGASHKAFERLEQVEAKEILEGIRDAPQERNRVRPVGGSVTYVVDETFEVILHLG